MDPLSITVGIIGVVDAGISLSERLKGRIDDYRNAEREVEELAHEIDLCTTLLDVFGESLDKPENAYPKNVARQTKRLVADMRSLFDDITRLMAKFDYSIKASSRYVIDAGSLRGHHDKLKSLQLSFIFMQSICPPQRTSAPAIAAAGGTLGQLGSFEGTIQHLPVYTGSRGPSDDTPITYKATLVLQPSPFNQDAGTPAGTSNAGRPQDLTDRLEEVRKNKRLKKKLAALTSSPFFSKETLGSFFNRPNGHTLTSALRSDDKERRYMTVPTPMAGRSSDYSDYSPGNTSGFQGSGSDHPHEMEELRRRMKYSDNEDDRRRAESQLRGMKEEKMMSERFEQDAEVKEKKYAQMRVKKQAENDVDDILDYLFDDGSNMESREDSPPRVVIVEPDRPAPRSPRSPRSPLYTTADPDRSRAPRYDPSPMNQDRGPSDGSGSTSPARPVSYRCNDCDRKIKNMRRYECSSCPDYDLCEECFTSSMLRHRHPKQQFVARS